MPLCQSCQTPLPPTGLCGLCVLARLTEMEREPARRLGDYDLVEELDRGGMGVVWRARHRELGRTVALKMIRGGAAAGESEIVRFRTEAEAVARLEHPGIVPVFELGEVDGVPFFTMPLLTGGSLRRRLDDGKLMRPREAAALMVPVAQAIAHAHGRGVLHRDLKPANILLDAAGAPHVADFGLARFMESDSSLTRTGAVLGTPAYAAPEQTRGDPATTAGDIFSLGAILYHLLCGRPPWDARDAVAAMQLAAQHDPPSLRALNPAIHRDLHIITMRCLERGPAKRYATAAALADDLDRWLRGEPIHARAASTLERLWKWALRRPAAAALIGLGALSLAAVFTQRVFSERRVRAESEAARRAEAAAVQSARRLQENLYASDMSLAFRAQADGNQTLVRRILRAHEQQPGAEEWRGFEYHWLKAEAEKDSALVLRGHEGPVRTLAVSPDGALLASGGDDGFVRLWRLPSGEPAGRIPEEAARENDLGFLADKVKMSQRLAKFPGFAAQMLANPASISILTSRAAPGYLAAVQSLSFSHDGSLLAVGGNMAKVWHVADREMLQVFPLERSQVAFHPRDDRLFLVSGHNRDHGSGEGKVTVWDGRTGAAVPGDFGAATLPPIFSADGSMVSLANGAGGIVSRATADGRVVFHNRNNEGHRLKAVAVAPDGNISATADDRGPEVLIAQKDSAILVPLSCGTADPVSLAWSPDSSLLAASGGDHRVRLWTRDLRERPPLLGHEGAVQSVVFTTDGRLLISAGDDATVRVWDLQPRPQGLLYDGLSDRVLTRGDMLFAYCRDTARLWKGDKVILHTTPPGGCYDYPLGWSADGTRAAVFRYQNGRENNLINGSAELLWHDSTSGQLLRTAPLGEQRHVRAGALSPDGTRLATSDLPFHGFNGVQLLLRDAGDGRILAKCHADIVNPIVLTFAGSTRLAAGDGSTRLCVLDAEKWTQLWQKKGPIAAAPLAVPGALAVAIGDHIHLCHPDTGADLAILTGHTAQVLHFALHPDGRTLASASADRTVRLWHLPTRRELGILHTSPGAPFSALAFTPDGRQLLAARRGGPALIFDTARPLK